MTNPLPTLVAPPSLTGRINNRNSSVVAARYAFVRTARQAGYDDYAIAKALGVTRKAVDAIRRAIAKLPAPPGVETTEAPKSRSQPVVRATITQASCSSIASIATVTLPRAPWDSDMLAWEPREATRPRRACMVAPRKTRAEMAIEAIRAAHREATSHA